MSDYLHGEEESGHGDVGGVAREEVEEEGGQEAVLGTLPMSVNQRNIRSASQRPGNSTGDIAHVSQSEAY